LPPRTKEQLQQIYEDLLEVRKVVNRLHDMGELWPTPMNGKAWEEEKDEHYFAGINAMTDLIRSGRIKSCEVISLCEMFVADCQAERTKTGFWNHYGKEYNSSSEQAINNGAISINNLIDGLSLAISGQLSAARLSQLEEYIDNFGNSACGPRAMIENPGKSDGVDNNASLPKANGVNFHFRA